MKKLKIALVALFLMGVSATYAQEDTAEYTPLTRYPHYSFWSNWSIGLNGGWTWRIQKETKDPAIDALNPHERWGWVHLGRSFPSYVCRCRHQN